MAKQKAYLLVGLPHTGGEVLAAALEHHAAALAAAGVRLPARSSDEMFRAAVEIRRDHRSWGLRRKDVEGMWSAICRRAYRTGDTVVVGHDLLAGCSREEIALLVDRLPGFTVHVVVTASAPDPRVSLFPDDQDLADVLARWSRAAGSPRRVHVIATDPADPGPAWSALGEVVGFDAGALPLPERSTPRPPDAAVLRVLSSSVGDLASYDELLAVGEAWTKLVADEGYDLRGESPLLLPRPPGQAPAGLPDGDRLAVVAEALSESVAELTRLRERTRELSARAARLERKRRRLKERLAGAV